MEVVEDVVIVGAGIVGLATSLGLHRLGIQSLVLESSESLRITGFAFTMWTNAWKAIDAIGIGNILRERHNQLTGLVTTSANSGLTTSELPFRAKDSQDGHDVRCVNRKVLLEVLESELPKGTIRYSSKVVRIQNANCFKSVHLSDGTIIKAKVLIGCDGVNSVVAKFLGLSKPRFVGRSAIRGFVKYKDGHDFEPKFMQFFGKGVRYGVIPCDDQSIYWFFTFSPSQGADKDTIEEDPSKMKEFVLSMIGNVSDKIRKVFEDTDLNSMICSPLRLRHPWDLIWGNISKDNVCVAGDALHPMTPDLGQGGCSALEDSVILSRILGKALMNDEKQENNEENEHHRRIVKGLEKFARERKWRGLDLISTAYVVGLMQQSDGVVMNFLRDNIFAKFLAGILLKKASFDCGNLI